MRYLKEYRLFEGLFDEYRSRINKIDSDYKEKIEKEYFDTKSLIEEYLYDILDYNLDKDLNKLNVPHYHPIMKQINYSYKLNIKKENLSVFIKDIKTANSRLKEDLGLTIVFKLYSVKYTISEMIEFLEKYKDDHDLIMSVIPD